MSHINLESSRLRKTHSMSGTFGNIDSVLAHDLVLSDDSPSFMFFDAGSVDRTIVAPPRRIGGGQFFWIKNFGTTGNLKVVDALGVSIVIIAPDQACCIFSSMSRWASMSPQGSGGATGYTFNTVRVTGGGTYNAVNTDDLIIVANAAPAPTQVVMPLASTRVRGPVQIKDGKGDANINNTNVTFSGGEKADGLTSVPIRTMYGSLTLSPNPAGGWVILNFG